MLILSRLKNESIVIDNNITVVVLDIQAGRVALGITAPRHIPVHRREIQNAIEREKTSHSSEDKASA